MPTFIDCEPCDRLYDAKKNQWLPHDSGDLDVCEILDSLSFAVTTGKLNSRTWVRAVFHNEAAWDGFLEELAVYEEVHRIRDPWWWALAKLAEHEDVEEGFSTAEDMAGRLPRTHGRPTRSFESQQQYNEELNDNNVPPPGPDSPEAQGVGRPDVAPCDRAAAQARGEGERKLTAGQYAALHEMLAAAPAGDEEES